MTGRADTWVRRGLGALLALVCLAPIFALVARAAGGASTSLIAHLGHTVLARQLGTSLAVAAGAAAGAVVLAAGSLLCALFEFAGRRVLERLLIVPLLIPAWCLAIVYEDTLRASGALALAAILAVASAPLVGLLAGTALSSLPASYAELLIVLGRGRPLRLVRQLVPLAAPSLAVAAALAFLLAFGDHGAARVLGVSTLTVGFLQQAFGREDGAAGALLGLVLLAVSLVPALLGAWLIARRSGQDAGRLATRRHARRQLPGGWVIVPWLAGAPLLVGGVVAPGLILGRWTLQVLGRVRLATLGSDAAHSLLCAGASALVAAGLAMLLLWLSIRRRSGARSHLGWVALPAFALPSIVLAIGVLWLLPTGGESGILARVNATPAPLILASGVRFTAVLLVAGEAVLLRQARAHVDLLRLVGRTRLRDFVLLLRPFLARPFAVAGAFTFLQALQDLALPTLLMPFGFSTATGRVFQYVQTGSVRHCGVWILCLAAMGLYPLFALARSDGPAPQRSAG